MKNQSFYSYETEAVGKGTQMSLIPMQNQKQRHAEDNENTDQKRSRTKKLGKRNFEEQRQQKRGLEDNEKYPADSRYK